MKIKPEYVAIAGAGLFLVYWFYIRNRAPGALITTMYPRTAQPRSDLLNR